MMQASAIPGHVFRDGEKKKEKKKRETQSA